MNDLSKILLDAHQGSESDINDLIAMFKPLISKYACQLPCDCAETDLIIAMLEFIRDLDAERIKSCNDAVLVSYITPMLRNKKIDIYRNVALKNLVVVNVDYDLCEFRNYDIDERIDCMNCLNQLSDKQRNILIRRFKWAIPMLKLLNN